MLHLLTLASLFLGACSRLAPVLPPSASLPATLAEPTVSEAMANPTSPATFASPARTRPNATTSAPATEAPQTGFIWLGNPSTTPQGSFTVQFHPDGGLYVGDRVSMEVIAPEGFQPDKERVTVEMEEQPGSPLGSAAFGAYGIGGRIQATLVWVWDTSNLQAGEHTLKFTVQPDGPSWIEMVKLLPRGQLPPVEQNAHWAQAESECCLVHYITGTAAERDLPALLPMLDAQAQDASLHMGATLPQPVEVNLLPRMIGNGGFADGGISLSYLDRNYVSKDTAIIFHHELIHILDARLGGGFRPSFLVEGLAVYESGGHFKPEPLMPRAAALLPPEKGCMPVTDEGPFEGGPYTAPTYTPSPFGGWIRTIALINQKPCSLDLYIPLSDLVKNFYLQQHEIGYLEAASLIEYMVNTWGWKAYSDFYRDIHLPKPAPFVGSTAAPAGAGPANTASKPAQGAAPERVAVDDALQRHFGLQLTELERRFLQALRDEPLQARWVEDLRLDLIFHDRGRGYQQEFDPSAYFLYAWLPNPKQMRERGIVADFLRGPDKTDNLALETLLESAGVNLQAADYSRTAQLDQAATSVLTAAPRETAFRNNPLAADYYALAGLTGAKNDQPQYIQVNLNTAVVWASKPSGPELFKLYFLRAGGTWMLLNTNR